MEVRPVWKGGQPNIKIYIKKWRSVPFFILISIFYYMFFFFSKTSIYTFIFFTQYAEYIIFIAALYIPIKTADFITLMNYTIKKGIYAHIFCRSYNNKTKRRRKKKYFFAELNPIVKPEETTYQHDRARGAEHREYEKEDDGRGWWRGRKRKNERKVYIKNWEVKDGEVWRESCGHGGKFVIMDNRFGKC